MARQRSYTDAQLVEAIAVSRSWRGTLRHLGLAATSASAMRSVRAEADRLAIDYGHFSRGAHLDNDRLRAAVATAGDWEHVAAALQLQGPASVAAVKGRAARLKLDVAHLETPIVAVEEKLPEPDIANLGRAGALFAAAWMTLCGQDVAWPLEAARYDLLVGSGSAVRRVQVKTTSVRVGKTWKVYLSTSRGGRRTYDPEEIDDFFIIDGEFGCHLIPVDVVGGLHAIHLAAYSAYRLTTLGPPGAMSTGE
ncbi:hypothetical protein ACWKWP_13075 [Agromyces soli]